MAEDYKRKVAKELYDLGPAWHDLSNAVSKLNSEQEVREFLWSARAAIQNRSNIPYKRLAERAPTFTDVIYGEMPGSKIDYDKVFGKDWYNNFADIDYGKVQHVAMKAGQDPKKVLHEMAEEATRRQRNDIAHGGIDGKITTIVFPRATEAVEQGRSPEPTEVAMDVGQIGSYAVPYGGAIGRLASAIPKVAKFGKTVSAAKAVASNVTPPVINEAMDAAYYDEENPRGEFDWGDVGGATAMNFGAPYASKRLVGMGLRKIGKPGAGKIVEEFGEGATAGEKSSEMLASQPKYVPQQQRLIGSSVLRNSGDQSSQMFRTNTRAWGQINKDHKLYEIAAEDGKSLAEKYSKWLKRNNLPENTPIEQTLGWNTGNKDFVSRDAAKLYDELGLGATENLKTAKDLAGEEAVKNLIINKWGDYGYEGDPIQFIPLGIGSHLHKKNLEDAAEEKKLKAAEELYKKWEKKIQEVYGE
jgi:hypothetical protein